MKRTIDKALAAYQLRDLQSFRNILITLDRTGNTVEDALKYINYQTMFHEKIPALLCKTCGGKMSLYPVNTGPNNQVPEADMKSQWYCHSCDISIFRKNAPEKEHTHMIRKQIEYHVSGGEDYDSEWGTEEFHRVCECGGKQYLAPINIKQGNQNLHGYKSVWQCPSCGFENYKLTTTEVEIRRHKNRMKNKDKES